MEYLQQLVGEWVVRCFGRGNAYSPTERAMRVMEEAMELCQAEGILLSDAHRLATVVWSRPEGKYQQEAGGVFITILAYCSSRYLSAQNVLHQELARILSLPIEKFQKRQAEKEEAGVVGEYDKTA